MKCVSPGNKNAIARRAQIFGAFAFVCFGACVAAAYGASAQTGDPQSAPTLSQAQIRAAFIFNFSKFAEWPAGAFADAGSPMTVCFVGAEDVRAAFQSISSGKAVTGRFVEDHAIKSVSDLRSCQVVYVDSPNSPLVVDVLKFVRQGKALAIGTSDDFLARGGMIRLLVENNRMRFDVNVGATGRVNIHLSSKLLALARSVVALPDPAGN
jgi:YfiR/HmsC-like